MTALRIVNKPNYKTSDGTLFEDRTEAARLQFMLDAAVVLYGKTATIKDVNQDFLGDIFDHSGAIISLLQDAHDPSLDKQA